MTFLTELRRRNVFKVAVAYGVVAWLLIQVVVAIEAPLNLPEWFDTAIIVLVALGFPVAIIIAWAFEITPDGIRPTGAAVTDQNIPPQTGRKLNTVIISILVVALLLIAFDAYVLTDNEDGSTAQTAQLREDVDGNPADEPDPQIGVPEKSIAVLPFANLSSDPEQEYFSDGLSEELINKLSQVDELQVSGRNSSFAFKGREAELAEIGDTLNVNYVLQGSVRRSGDSLRISAQILDTRQGFNVWSDTFDRDLIDIFAVQDEIADAVTTALQVSLGLGRFAQQGMTNNVQAYDYYLQGIARRRQASAEYFVEGIRLQEAAVALDPEFGLAWNALAETARLASVFNDEDSRDRFMARAQEAGLRARQLAPQLLETQLSEASGLHANGEFLDSEARYLALIDLYGNTSYQVNLGYATFLQQVGRAREALPFSLQAYRMAPDNPELFPMFNYYLLSRYAEIYEHFANETGPMPAGNKVIIDIGTGRLDEARQSVTALPLTRDRQLALIDYLENGDSDSGLNYIRELMETSEDQVIYRHLGSYAIKFGDPELALDIMRYFHRFVSRGVVLPQVWSEIYTDVRVLPGFRTLMEENGLADYWRTSGNWPDKCRPIADTEKDFECF